MNTELKILIFFLLLTSSHPAYLQIMEEKTAILKKLGSPSDTGIDDKGNEYLVYDKMFRSDVSGFYNRSMILYFLEFQDSLEVCTHLKILYPETEKEANMKFLNENMQAVDSLEWRDKTTGYRYRLGVVHPFCTLLVWLDK